MSRCVHSERFVARQPPFIYACVPSAQTLLRWLSGAQDNKSDPSLQQRKRLSVVSTSQAVEGIGDGIEELRVSSSAEAGKKACTIITEAFEATKKGYAPYNPRKKNQDAVLRCVLNATFARTGSAAGDARPRAPDCADLALFGHPRRTLPNGDDLFLVLDGHGEAGERVSAFVKERFAQRVCAHAAFETDLVSCLGDAIRSIEEEMLRSGGFDTAFSGTTFVCCVVRGDLLTAANIGDSRLTFGVSIREGEALVAEPCTIDHKPDLPDEKARILAVGGRVFAVKYDDGIDGPARVWLAHADIPGLAMSRSLGDTVAHKAGVSSEPQFFQVKVLARQTSLLAWPVIPPFRARPSAKWHTHRCL